MSPSKNHLEMPTPELIAPGAPDRAKEERRCENGVKCVVFEQMSRFGDAEVGKVNIYQQGRYADSQGPAGPVLCYRCQKRAIDEELKEFAKQREKKDRAEMHAENERIKNSVAGKIRRAREKRGWSQLQLAKEAGLDPRRVSDYETRASRPYTKAAIAIAEVLGMDPEELRRAS